MADGHSVVYATISLGGEKGSRGGPGGSHKLEVGLALDITYFILGVQAAQGAVLHLISIHHS